MEEGERGVGVIARGTEEDETYPSREKSAPPAGT